MIDDQAMRSLLDREQIREIVGPRYGRAMDWYDLDLLKSCFHPDATLDYGYFKGNAHEWCAMRVLREDPNVLNRFHYIFPPQIEIAGDAAEAECNGIGGHRVRKGAAEEYHLFGSRYLDRLERRHGQWKLASRVVRIDFAQTLPGDAAPDGKFASLPFMMNPRPDHPDYRRLANP
jgi:hypothetical protein